MTATAPDPITFSADQLLRIPDSEPERLFPNDLSETSRIFHELVKAWHPDRNSDVSAQMVTAHLNVLWDTAKKRIKAGTWADPNTLVFRALDGKTYRVHYDKKHEFELGQFFIGPTTLAFVLRREHRAPFENGLEKIRALDFADDKMRKTHAVALPDEFKTYETAESFIVLLKKDPEAVLLGDLLKHEGGKLDSKHAAWIMTRLHNLTCYLEWAGLTHNAIDAATLFVNPRMHSVSLLGGWWHAAKIGGKMQSMPGYAADFLPEASAKSGKATTHVDLELIRAVGRELIGDRGGTRFAMAKKKPAPEAFIAWLRHPTTGKAQKDLQHWDDVLKESFGPRRFTEMKIKYSDIYQPGG